MVYVLEVRSRTHESSWRWVSVFDTLENAIDEAQYCMEAAPAQDLIARAWEFPLNDNFMGSRNLAWHSEHSDVGLIN